jgi:hypothetical protein
VYHTQYLAPILSQEHEKSFGLSKYVKKLNDLQVLKHWNYINAKMEKYEQSITPIFYILLHTLIKYASIP